MILFVPLAKLRILLAHVQPLNSLNTIFLSKKAVERNITIIGEAIKRVLGFDTTAPISNARQIIAMRNIIIHDYESIETEVLYAAVVKHLPPLKQETTALLLAYSQ
jgi:uncharacterized protein with HEPN domain